MSNSQSSAWAGRGPQEVTSIKIRLADSNGSVSYLRRLREPLKTFKASNSLDIIEWMREMYIIIKREKV